MSATPETWQKACATALTAMPGMGPARLSALLEDLAPDAAWAMLAERSPLPPRIASMLARDSGLANRWRTAARRTDPLDMYERYQQREIEVCTRYGNYPRRLTDDEHAPAVLFLQGNVDALAFPTVAIVGTRHCTYEGRSVARSMALGIAEAGIAVVSGLALGIDGAAHEGSVEASLGAPPVAVVGSGLDVVYPKRHRSLWDDVRRAGLLVSESPLGAQPEPWRFPARNRIIAGLADVIVVIESHRAGGSLLTVDQALERGVPVMAVPGSIRSAASVGTNRLLAEGAFPACSVDDVVDLVQRSAGVVVEAPPALMDVENDNPSDLTLLLDAGDRQVLEAIDGRSTSLDELLLRTSLSFGEVSVVLARLEARGLIAGDGGWRFRTHPRAG